MNCPMKKEYIAPQLSEMDVLPESILGASELRQVGESVTVTPGGEYSGSDWASRRNDMWEEEDF